MLKPADPGPPGPERPIGELVHELIEQGKSYAQAELGLVKAIAAAKGKALGLPVAMFGAAFICLLASVTALAVGIVIGAGKVDRAARRRIRRDADLRRHRGTARLVRLQSNKAGLLMRDTPEIVAARSEVDRSRARVMATAHELQERISPKVLARDAWEGAKDKGAEFAEDAVDAVRARPLAAGGVVAALTMFLAREPLIDLAGKIAGGVKDKRKSRKNRKANTKTESTETA